MKKQAAVISTARIIEPGQELRRVRERLRMKYRDVEEASQRIAQRRANDEFVVGLSRLADIENRGTVPSIYRLYSLCAIYSLDFRTVVQWYGVDLSQLPADAARSPHEHTRLLDTVAIDDARVEVPEVPATVDFRRTVYISRHLQRWGRLPATLLGALDLQRTRYAFLGTDDWSMYPILAPASFVQIDENKRKVINEGWSHELERPIYLLEHRAGYRCAWCTERDGWLVALSHPSSQVPAEIFRYPGAVEIVGQVVGVAMRLDSAKRRHTRF